VMKIPASNLPKPGSRRGFGLLAMMLVLIIVGSTFVLAGLNNRQSSYLQQQAELHKQMQIAKANLLAYAANSAALMSNARGPGFLPCPATPTTDPDNDGIVSDVYGTDCTVTLGRLPTYVDIGGQKFYLNNYNAGIDQQFWYAVGIRYTESAPAYRRSYFRTSPIDSDSVAHRFTLDGTPGYVALIIAPGEALESQDRVSVSGRSSSTNYLEGGNGSSNNYYTEYNANPSQFNDQVLGITLDEFILAVGPRVAASMKVQLDAYYLANSNQYPDPAAFTATMHNSGIAWLDSSNVANDELWSTLATDITYVINPAKNVATLYFSDCTNITFTLTYGAGVTRSGASCT